MLIEIETKIIWLQIMMRFEKKFSTGELGNVINKLLPTITHARVIALHGPLGAGKTTFVQAVARVLGIKEAITSPTFTYVSRYALPSAAHGKKWLYHFDLYRLMSQESFFQAGFDEMLLDEQGFVFIEWPEIIEAVLPAETCRIYLEHVVGNEEKREIRVFEKN